MDLQENVLVPLPGLLLPPDLPWRMRFVELVQEHLLKVKSYQVFEPPRFFGYYFKDGDPVAVAGPWTVLLDPLPPLVSVPDTLDMLTQGNFNILSERDEEPQFLLVHDRHDGACWLWRYRFGMRFVMAQEPTMGEGIDEAA
jgi:hypothetical protein